MNTGGHAPDEEVRILKRQVERNLTEPFIFQCISEHHIDGIHNVQPINDLPGWWGKTNLFSGSVSHSRNLWLDLDVTITRNIDRLVEPITSGAALRAIRNWAVSGHNGVQSSVMYWEGIKPRIISDRFDHADAVWPPQNNAFWDNGQVKWGDQEWITHLRDTGQLEVEYFDPAHVVSYKYHCQNGLPIGSKVQVFHGKPDPCDCSEAWIKECRK
jgi:hypothetical protein